MNSSRVVTERDKMIQKEIKKVAEELREYSHDAFLEMIAGRIVHLRIELAKEKYTKPKSLRAGAPKKQRRVAGTSTRG